VLDLFVVGWCISLYIDILVTFCVIYSNNFSQIEAALALTVYSSSAFENASDFDPTNFSDDTKRQLFYVGSKSLSDEEMKNLSSLISSMGSIYAQASPEILSFVIALTNSYFACHPTDWLTFSDSSLLSHSLFGMMIPTLKQIYFHFKKWNKPKRILRMLATKESMHIQHHTYWLPLHFQLLHEYECKIPSGKESGDIFSLLKRVPFCEKCSKSINSLMCLPLSSFEAKEFSTLVSISPLRWLR
jgi:hypothetical protein